MGIVPISRPPEPRAHWLVLAADGPALELAQAVPVATRVRIVADPLAFAELLGIDRPRVAIVTEPPAGARELDLLRGERPRRQGLRTIHLSPAGELPARLAALRDGFDEALPQTIEPEELARAALVEERMRSRPSTSVPIADGFELDLVAHELRLDGRSVHLRPKEFQLLAMLAAHPGRAYSRRQLLDRVWGSDQVGDPRTVDVHVRWLRSGSSRSRTARST
jgi:DNA-binding response OmpR family regulator